MASPPEQALGRCRRVVWTRRDGGSKDLFQFSAGAGGGMIWSRSTLYLPQGEENEVAARRELREETGVTSVELVGEARLGPNIAQCTAASPESLSEAPNTMMVIVIARSIYTVQVPGWLCYQFPPDLLERWIAQGKVGRPS